MRVSKVRQSLVIIAAAFAPTAVLAGDPARLQVIHNAADPDVAVVDIYVNDALAIPDFAFRTATEFLSLPSGVELRVGVAPGDSDGPEDVLATFPFVLAAGERYVAIANGVLDPNGFAPNPEGRSTAFEIFVKPEARENSLDSGQVDLFVLHGATDAPAVRVLAVPGGQIVPSATYGDQTGYLSIDDRSYYLYVRTAQGNAYVAGYLANLNGLAGNALTVFASGFLNPAQNRNGASFGLFAATPTGDVVELPRRDPFAGLVNGRGKTGAANKEDFASTLALGQNLPNPFQGRTTIDFVLPEERMVSLRVVDLQGRVVSELVRGVLPAGPHAVEFTPEGSLSSGIYYYELRSGDERAVQKMLLTR